MYRVFESDLGLDIKEASQTISATRADAFSAELLERRGRQPASRRCSGSRPLVDGRPLELLRSVYLPDYFQFTISLTRPRGSAGPDTA